MLATSIPGGNEWGFRTSNCETPTLTYGTLLTGNATANGVGAWVSCIGALAEDVYGIQITFTDNNTNATARTAVADIGVDPAGGTAFSAVIPDLIHSQAGGSGLGGVTYYFPLFIKAGSSIGARTTQNVVSGTSRVMIRVFGKPSRPDLIQWGTKVHAIGTKATASSGQALTAGSTNAESAYISLGSPTKLCWWWQVGFGLGNGTVTGLGYHIDLARGDATTKRDIIKNRNYQGGTTETLTAWPDFQGFGLAGPESTIYARGSCSGTALAGHVLAYGLS